MPFDTCTSEHSGSDAEYSEYWNGRFVQPLPSYALLAYPHCVVDQVRKLNTGTAVLKLKFRGNRSQEGKNPNDAIQ